MISPSIPAISTTLCTRRIPSRMRSMCSMRLRALAMCMRDGIRRVQSVVEIAGIEGEIISARELFAFHYRGERHDGRIECIFEPTRMRPDFVVRAARYGLDKELLDALGITG